MNLLYEYISKTCVRQHTFSKVCQYMTEMKFNNPVIVETGTMMDRPGHNEWCGNGNSTFIFNELCKIIDGHFYSIDISQDVVSVAAAKVDNCSSVVCMDSVEFLNNFSLLTNKNKIDLLYLDSMGFDPHNPTPCQAHALKEFQAAEKFLHDNSMVFLDDTHGNVYSPGGKAGLVVPYLLENNWKCLVYSDQAIFLKKENDWRYHK